MSGPSSLLFLGRVESERLGDYRHEEFRYAFTTAAFIPRVTILNGWINKEAASQHPRDDHQLKADDRREEKEGWSLHLKFSGIIKSTFQADSLSG